MEAIAPVAYDGIELAAAGVAEQRGLLILEESKLSGCFRGYVNQGAGGDLIVIVNPINMIVIADRALPADHGAAEFTHAGIHPFAEQREVVGSEDYAAGTDEVRPRQTLNQTGVEVALDRGGCGAHRNRLGADKGIRGRAGGHDEVDGRIPAHFHSKVLRCGRRR